MHQAPGHQALHPAGAKAKLSHPPLCPKIIPGDQDIKQSQEHEQQTEHVQQLHRVSMGCCRDKSWVTIRQLPEKKGDLPRDLRKGGTWCDGQEGRTRQGGHRQIKRNQTSPTHLLNGDAFKCFPPPQEIPSLKRMSHPVFVKSH